MEFIIVLICTFFMGGAPTPPKDPCNRVYEYNPNRPALLDYIRCERGRLPQHPVWPTVVPR